MEFESYFRFVLALVFVIGMIGVLAMIARRLGFGYRTVPKGQKSKRRLSISEIMPLDGKRRLVLVRRDETEHLIILGQNSETVIERGIVDPELEKDVLNDLLAAGNPSEVPEKFTLPIDPLPESVKPKPQLSAEPPVSSKDSA